MSTSSSHPLMLHLCCIISINHAYNHAEIMHQNVTVHDFFSIWIQALSLQSSSFMVTLNWTSSVDYLYIDFNHSWKRNLQLSNLELVGFQTKYFDCMANELFTSNRYCAFNLRCDDPYLWKWWQVPVCLVRISLPAHYISNG